MVAIEATLTGSEGGIRRADVRTGSIDNECRRPKAQDTPSIAGLAVRKKILAAGLGENFSLDIPFHRTPLIFDDPGVGSKNVFEMAYILSYLPSPLFVEA
jgi:hypothetical protein